VSPAIERLTRTYRHVDRYSHILRVLARHGFGQILERLRIEQYTQIALRMFHAERTPPPHHTRAERLRLALEELGPTFVKLGQLLSTRPDLVPADLARELEKLQDQATPFPAAEARALIAEELGRPLEEVFRSFDDAPLAAASLGQVHRATLATDGREVVIKVMRPGIRRSVETDLEILTHLAAIAESHVEALEVQRPSEIVEEFRRAVARELDYRVEAAHLRRFRRMFAGDVGVRVPEVVTSATTTRVLTMERLAGAKVSELARSGFAGYDRELIARRGADAILAQIFLHGFFHADPHPGNVLILSDNVVGFVDLGQIGHLSQRTRHVVADLLAALTERDAAAASDALVELTRSDESPVRHELETDVAEFIDWHFDRPVGELRLGEMAWALIELASRHGRTLGPELFLVLKALGTLESLSRTLDPSFDLGSRVRPVLRRLALERLSPRVLAADAAGVAGEVAGLLRELPRELRGVLRQLRAGRLHVEFEHKGLTPVLHTHELATNRLVFAIVLAALLVASSLLVVGDIPPLWHEIPVIGLVGYLISGVIGLGLLWSILRRGRL
jgi:ubiquinone biosynthesis protein